MKLLLLTTAVCSAVCWLTLGNWTASSLGLFSISFSLLLLTATLLLAALVGRLRMGNKPTIAFFHPYCNAGGGGERVLWCAIRAFRATHPSLRCVVYSGDSDPPAAIRAKALSAFGVRLEEDDVHFIFLKSRVAVEASTWPHLTLIMQSLGSLALGLEALANGVPDVYVDTMGYAFTLPLFWLAGSRIGCYVHYPTISTDMLARVRTREESFNNNSSIANSAILSTAKHIYYVLFALLYGYVGRFAQIVMVNSTWTHNHIVSIWRVPKLTHTVYPPCDTSNLQKLPLTPRQNLIISVSQFRPEKDQALQIKAFARFMSKHPTKKFILRLIGSCRHEDDFNRVAQLKSLARGLHVHHAVEFAVNVSYDELKSNLQSALIGIHTMYNEHFGIGVVEFMAAGAITLAHNSGGPRADIVVPHNGGPTGYLAATEEEYATCMEKIAAMSDVELNAMRLRARHHVQDRFSEATFETEFVQYLQPLVRGL